MCTDNLFSFSSNKVQKHYHCIRCSLSLATQQSLEIHLEKHHQEEETPSSHSLGPQSPIYLQKPRPDSPMDSPQHGIPGTSNGSPETPSKSQG